MLKLRAIWFSPLLLAAFLSICGCEYSYFDPKAVSSYYGHASAASTPAKAQGVRESTGTRTAPHVAATPAPSPTPRSSPEVTDRENLGPTCDHDPGVCLGLKYVVYEPTQEDPTRGVQDAVGSLREANLLWRECGIQFQIDHYAKLSRK